MLFFFWYGMVVSVASRLFGGDIEWTMNELQSLQFLFVLMLIASVYVEVCVYHTLVYESACSQFEGCRT